MRSLALFLWILAAPLQASEIAIIVSPGVPIDRLSNETLRDIYLLKRTRWPDGQPIVVLNLPATNPLRKRFFSQVLEVNETTVAEVWMQMRYRGKQPPHVIPSAEAALRFVVEIPGALAYVPAALSLEEIKHVENFTLTDEIP